MMSRVPNWNVELAALARELGEQGFEWGKTDCASVARAALVAMYGEDLVAPYIHTTYTTKIGASRAFRKIGSMVDIITSAGAREVPLHATRDGDFLVFQGDGSFENMATKIGGLWIISDPELNAVSAVKITPTSMASDTKAFRF